jgi:hypothetical protein
MEKRLIRSPAYLCAPHLLLKGPLDFEVILYGDYAIEGDLDATIFNRIASII